MKIRSLFSDRPREDGTIIATFGQARLVRTPRGKYELHGGTQDDRTAAHEWISLFMHEAVVPEG